jgi:membrane protease YdiL (CAAX protease family)
MRVEPRIPHPSPSVAPDASPSRVRPGATRQVVIFFALTYLVTWTLFTTAGLLPSGQGALRLPLLLLGSFAPSLTAVALTARGDGTAGVRRLLGRLLRWRVGVRWYAFALGYLALVKGGVALVHRATWGSWPENGADAWYAVLVAILVAGIVGGPLGEEVGWRGYALPRLTARLGPAGASLVLGVVWASWHLPLFFLSGLSRFGDQYGQSFPTYLLQVTALSVALAWLVRGTGGSLLLAVLMHSAINQTKDLVPSSVTGADHMWALSSSADAWYTVALLWLGAGCLLFLMRRPRRRAEA